MPRVAERFRGCDERNAGYHQRNAFPHGVGGIADVRLHMPPQKSNPQDFPYDTRLNVLFPPLAHIDANALVGAVTHPWYNQTLARVNDSVVRLGVMTGEYHWHEHADDDEFFFVLEGKFLIDLEPRADGITPGRVVALGPREGFVVPKGVRHRTRAPVRSVILMVETANIVPTGD